MINKIIKISILFLLVIFSKSNFAQITSNISFSETKNIINLVLSKGFHQSKNFVETGDSFYFKKNKFAFETLHLNDVRAYKAYPLRIFKEIHNYQFADSFDKYFYCDTAIYNVYFYRKIDNRNQVFAQSQKSTNYYEFTQLFSTSDFGILNLYPNREDNDNIIVVMGLSEFFIVINNSMYIIVNGIILKAREYFKLNSDQFPIEGLTKGFLGYQSGRSVLKLFPPPTNMSKN